MDSKAIEALARLGITLARWERGRQYVNCPQCALNAKHDHNRRARKLAVSIEPDGAVLWFCNNCEWSGGFNDHSRARQEASRARPRRDLVRAVRRSLTAGGDRVSLSALNGEVHNTKIRRGKGDMPWATAGQTADSLEPRQPRGRPGT